MTEPRASSDEPSTAAMIRSCPHGLAWLAAGLLLLLPGGCRSVPQAPPTPPALVGAWDYTMTHPDQGRITGVMTIEQRPDGTYTGHVSAVEIGIDEVLIVDRMDIDGPDFTMYGWLTGMELLLKGTVRDDVIEGTNQVIGMTTFTFEARRAPQ